MKEKIIQYITNSNEIEGLDFEAGTTILIDKPREWTSFDVVNKVRYQMSRIHGKKRFKVGHAGTLDPLATGLLILCTGKNTKIIDQFQNDNKSYFATIKLGATTQSYDREHEEENIKSLDSIDVDKVSQVIKQFVGVQMQKAPIYSALKKNGVPMYKLARKGVDVVAKSREINILDIRNVKINLPFIEFDIDCSKGTYIRSIAFDIGEKLGVGGYLYDLCRTSSGHLQLKDALTLDDLIQKLELRPTKERE